MSYQRFKKGGRVAKSRSIDVIRNASYNFGVICVVWYFFFFFFDVHRTLKIGLTIKTKQETVLL